MPHILASALAATLTAALVGVSNASVASAQVGRWLTRSVEVPRDVGCAPAPVDVEHRWYQTGAADTDAQLREIDAELRALHPGGYQTRVLAARGSGRPLVLAVARYTVKCRDAAGRVRPFASYRHVAGYDRAEVARRAARLGPDARVERMIDAEAEIAARARVVEDRRRVTGAPAPPARGALDAAKATVRGQVARPAAAGTREWVFLGFALAERAGCINDPRTSTTYAWIATGGSYEAERKRVRAEVRGAAPHAIDASEWRVRPGRTPAIALVRARYACRQWNGPDKPVTSYSWVGGADRAAIEAKLAARRQRSDVPISLEVTQWVDVEAEVRRFEQDPAAAGRTSTQTGVRG
jgi:hypothetical protein